MNVARPVNDALSVASIFQDPRAKKASVARPEGPERRKCVFSDSECWYLRKQILVKSQSL